MARDPKRIDTFCDTLKKTWKRYPDQRFGQFMMNFFDFVVNKTGRDIWFFEEPEMLELLKEFGERR